MSVGGEPQKPRPLTMPGWLCPACGGGNAPHVSRCPCVPLPAPMPATPIDLGLMPPYDITVTYGLDYTGGDWRA